MKHLKTALSGILLFLAMAMPAMGTGNVDPKLWADYLDFAYVYSAADAKTLDGRLKQYGAEAGITLEDYMVGYLGSETGSTAGLGDEKVRRTAIGFLLRYLVSRDPRFIDRASDVIGKLQNENAGFEDRYWFHYIEAHRAMEKGSARAFVEQNLEMWVDVVIPMESAFDTFDTLSLSQSSNSGFVSALPYVFENISRMILLRSQEMALNRELDPLAAIVRMLAANRVGAHPDVIPESASSLGYLDRIVSRLDGSESDAGSLTFTLALFEASKYHDTARGLLASEGFSGETLKAITVASGAYEIALRRAATAQGRAAVYIRVLRQLGEIYAAKQRLDVDPHVETRFNIEGAIGVYKELHHFAGPNGWEAAGFGRVGREAFVTAMHTLWEEIQEASLNAADYYLSRSLSKSGGNVEDVRSASQMYSRYLNFFKRYAKAESGLIPDSAYFAAYEAAKGYGDAFLRFSATKLTTPEVEMVTQRYMTALKLYPFDRNLWALMAESIDKLGRSKDYLGLAHPVARKVTRSRHVDTWVENREPKYREVAVVRQALSDDLVLMYLGFASRSGIDELQGSLRKLHKERDAVRKQLASLTGRSVGDVGPAKPAPGGADVARPLDQERKIARTRSTLAKLEHRIEARTRALPLYEKTLHTDGLMEELRAQRNHPLHTLLRRMYYEKNS